MTKAQMAELLDARVRAWKRLDGNAASLSEWRESKRRVMDALWAHGRPFRLSPTAEVHINADGDGYVIVDPQSLAPSPERFSRGYGTHVCRTWDYSRPARKPA